MSKVAITKCSNYETKNVEAAVQKALTSIGGLDKIINPNQRVLLKINALQGAPPEAAITTHPEVVRAVIRAVKKAGGIPLVGDNPGNAIADAKQTLELTGITQVVTEENAKIIPFEKEGLAEIHAPINKYVKTLTLSKAVLNADVIINLPKLKTHNLTLMTGAIKNMFGSVPGFHKSKYHIQAPKAHHFAEALVDIFQITKPTLTIMDAIIGMEGHGPAGGTPRFIGAILASFDSVALDAVSSAIINFNPFDIETTKVAHKRGLGMGDLTKIEVVGEPIENLRIKDFKHSSDVNQLLQRLPDFLFWLVRPITKYVRVEPYINPEKCQECQICAENCPAKCIDVPNINYKKCIMCFCCHELCPYKAIGIRQSWLAKKLGIGREIKR